MLMIMMGYGALILMVAAAALAPMRNWDVDNHRKECDDSGKSE